MIFMGIYKITYTPHINRINIYNDTCSLKCKICILKNKKNKNKKYYLKFNQIIQIINEYCPKIINFLGAEPTSNPMLYELVPYLKNNYDNIKVIIGHSNGFNLPPLDIDAIQISIKAISNNKHIELTGVSNYKILENFKTIYNAGIDISASTVFIPNFIDKDEIEKICMFISSIDDEIPFHIVGYIPVPWCIWRRPTQNEMEEAIQIAKKYLKKITYSRLSRWQMQNIRKIDKRFQSIELITI